MTFRNKNKDSIKPRTKAESSELRVPEAGQCNFTSIRKAARRISQLCDVVLAPCGLRSTQWSILIEIARAGSPTLSQLSDSLALDRSALTRNLKPLERDGLIENVKMEHDKRSRAIILTATGRAKVKESMVLWDEAQKNIESIFGKQNAKDLRASLEILASRGFAHAFESLREEKKSVLGTSDD